MMQTNRLGKTGMAVTPIGFGTSKSGATRRPNTRRPIPFRTSKLCPACSMESSTWASPTSTRPRRTGSAKNGSAARSAIGERSTRSRRRSAKRSPMANRITTIQQPPCTPASSGACAGLRTDRVDLVFIHSNGDDVAIQKTTDAVATLCELKQQGLVRAIGLSGKTIEGARLALDWADAIMVEYHLADLSHAEVIAAAAERGGRRRQERAGLRKSAGGRVDWIRPGNPRRQQPRCRRFQSRPLPVQRGDRSGPQKLVDAPERPTGVAEVNRAMNIYG